MAGYFFNKDSDLVPATLLKRDPGMVFFLVNSPKFLKVLIFRALGKKGTGGTSPLPFPGVKFFFHVKSENNKSFKCEERT